MLRVAITGVLARKLRLMLTSVAVVLGVGFVAGAFFLTDSMRQSFETLFQEATASIDVEVRSAEYKALQDSQAQGNPVAIDLAQVGVPPEIVERVRAIEGVGVAEGVIFEVGAQPLGKDGEQLGSFGPPSFGASWVEDAAELNVLRIVDGRAPGPGEVMLDETTFERGEFQLGDEVDILIQGGRKRETLRISGYVRFGESGNLGGASISVFEVGTIQELFDAGDRFSALDVVAEPGVGQEQLRDRIAAELGDDFHVVTGPEFAAEQSESIDSAFLDILQTVILAFAAIAVFVGAFTIFNTFTILVGQRTREFGLLRMLGAGRSQVLGIVALEALVLGLIASTIGIAAGYGIAVLLRELLNAFDFNVPERAFPVRSRTIVASYAVGVLVTVIASIIPAWRASRLSPLDALRASSSTRDRGLRILMLGAVLAIAGIAAVSWGFMSAGDDPIRATLTRIGVGFLIGIVGLALLSRLFIAPVTHVLSTALARGTTGRIAKGNVLRSRGRAATTSSALMVGLALASLVLVFYASLQRTVDNQIDTEFGADVTVYNSAFGGTATVIGDDVVRAIRTVDGVAELATQRWGAVVIGEAFDLQDGQARTVVAYDEGTIGRNEGLIRMRVVDGGVDPGDDGVLVDQDIADDERVGVGDELAVAFPSGTVRTFTVRGVYEPSQVVGGKLVVSVATFDELQPPALRAAAAVAVRVDEGEQPSRVAERIEEAIGEDSDYIRVLDTEGLREQFRQQLMPVLGLVMAMLSLSLVIALFGIGNTLALNVFERTREIGLLRAVGGTRGQLRRMIRVEAVLVAVFGAFVGVAVGVGAGFAIILALRDEGFVFAPNVAGLLAVLLGGFVAGVLASVLPARRAARIDVLEAIASE
jgi:putative ABC transport system permease protein